MNTLQTARYYQLGFKNNLQLVTTNQGLEWMGTDKELDSYYEELNEEKPMECEICTDLFYSNQEYDQHSIEEEGMCTNCAYKLIK